MPDDRRVQVRRQRKVFSHSDPPEFPVIELGQQDEIWEVVTYCVHRVR